MADQMLIVIHACVPVLHGIDTWYHPVAQHTEGGTSPQEEQEASPSMHGEQLCREFRTTTTREKCCWSSSVLFFFASMRQRRVQFIVCQSPIKRRGTHNLSCSIGNFSCVLLVCHPLETAVTYS